MQTKDYLRTIWRRKWIILIVAVVSIAVAYFGSSAMTPLYSASTVVRIAQVQDANVSYYDLGYAERIMNTYVYLLKSHPFLEDVINRLNLRVTTQDLDRMLDVELLANSELIRITATTPNPETSMQIANTLGDLLVEQGPQVYSGPGKSEGEILQEQIATLEANIRQDRALLQTALDANTAQLEMEAIQDLSSRIRLQEQAYASLIEERDNAQLREALLENSINVVEPAALPPMPSSPRMDINLALGTLLGLAGGLVVGFAVDGLDSSVDSSEDLKDIPDAPVLTSVPVIPSQHAQQKHGQGPAVLAPDNPGPAGDAFRVLTNTVWPADSAPLSRPLALLITSSESGAGKTTVLANLAMQIAQDGYRVLAVDTDLRHPSLHRAFGADNKRGVTNVLANPSLLSTSTQTTNLPGLSIITSGPPVERPAELQSPARIEQLIKGMAGKADVILFDSPPLSAFADAAALAPLMDGVLMVAARKQATEDGVQKAVRQLSLAGATVLGIVLNKAKPDRSGRHAYAPIPRKRPAMQDSGEPTPSTSKSNNANASKSDKVLDIKIRG
ncbi:MAG: polysaccharide biosynthesis tyrosine autokinase [Chloroflexi bacterium]|nr:polysaccharide biosynthesis tyrosine autokinase [Chloroflexota bacterium]